MSSGNPFDVQNSFIYSATGIEDVLEPAEVTEISTSNIDYVNPESVNGSVAFSVNKTSSGSEGKAVTISFCRLEVSPRALA